MSTTSTGLVGPDSLFGRIAQRWFELIVLSAVWLIGSLPVITAPVMTDWLVAAMRDSGRGESLPGPRRIFAHVRDRWRPATKLGALHLAVAALLIVGAIGPGGPGSVVVLAVLAVSAATWALVAPWTWVLLDADGVRACLRRAYVRAVRHLSWSVLSAISVLGGAALVIFAPAAVRLPVLLTVPGLVALVVVWTCDRARPLDPHQSIRGRESS